MPKKDRQDILLAWNKMIPSSEGQDPLGLNLRVSARLGSQLLYCITSVTPRARYYAFIPWCIQDYLLRQKGKPGTKSIQKAIYEREKVFSTSCVAFHDGKPCTDGRLVGSEKISKWYEQHKSSLVDFARIPYVKIPALDVYFASLNNLELFNFETAISETDDPSQIEPPSFEDIELSSLGRMVADSYGKVIDGLPVVRNILSTPKMSMKDISKWGKHGGLCELRNDDAPDREILIGLFFRNFDLKNKAHIFRRQTLLLILYLAKKMEETKHPLGEDSFNDAVYFGQFETEKGKTSRLVFPKTLEDIGMRWRMFEFHYYLSFALECLLVNVVDCARKAGLGGFKLEDMIREMNGGMVQKKLKSLIGLELSDNFLELTPSQVVQQSGKPRENGGIVGKGSWDEIIPLDHPLSERKLRDLILEEELFFSPESSAIALILLAIVLKRYLRWENDKYGNWLGQSVEDPYKDVTTPIILKDLRAHFEDFWNTTWANLAFHILSRFVVRQHEVLSYDKSSDGSSSFFHTDQESIHWRNRNYDRPSCHNPRLRSAILILKDLALLAEDTEDPSILALTAEGDKLLREELAKGEES